MCSKPYFMANLVHARHDKFLTCSLHQQHYFLIPPSSFFPPVSDLTKPPFFLHSIFDASYLLPLVPFLDLHIPLISFRFAHLLLTVDFGPLNAFLLPAGSLSCIVCSAIKRSPLLGVISSSCHPESCLSIYALIYGQVNIISTETGKQISKLLIFNLWLVVLLNKSNTTLTEIQNFWCALIVAKRSLPFPHIMLHQPQTQLLNTFK